jgi:outer membrane murein-binding lipoprotein Lpp
MFRNKKCSVKSLAVVIIVSLSWLACSSSRIPQIQPNEAKLNEISASITKVETKVDNLENQIGLFHHEVSTQLDSLSQDQALNGSSDENFDVLQNQMGELKTQFQKQRGDINKTLLQHESTILSIIEQLRSPLESPVIIHKDTVIIYKDGGKDSLTLSTNFGKFTITKPIGKNDKEAFAIIYTPYELPTQDTLSVLNTFTVNVLNREIIGDFIRFDTTHGSIQEGNAYEYSPKEKNRWELGFEYLKQNERFPCTIQLKVISQRGLERYDTIENFYLELERISFIWKFLSDLGSNLAANWLGALIFFAVGLMSPTLVRKIDQWRHRNTKNA